MPRRAGAAAIVAVLSAALAGCGPPSGEAPAPTATVVTPADLAGPVDIGGGRELAAICRGAGDPTVVLISGTGGGADEWVIAVPDGDPTAAAAPSTASVFDRVADLTRVCAYDRPGTTDATGTPTESTIVPQPTSAFDAAADLESLLTAIGETGPFLLVGASWGGLVAQAFTREHPDEVAGLVLVDAASMFLHEQFTAEQWAAWMAVIASDAGDGAERPDYEATRARWNAGPPPAVPAVVLSSDREWDLSVTPGASTWPAWMAAQDALANSLGARHVRETGSGHGVHVEHPAVVVDAIASVLDDLRAP